MAKDVNLQLRPVFVRLLFHADVSEMDANFAILDRCNLIGIGFEKNPALLVGGFLQNQFLYLFGGDVAI